MNEQPATDPRTVDLEREVADLQGRLDLSCTIRRQSEAEIARLEQTINRQREQYARRLRALEREVRALTIEVNRARRHARRAESKLVAEAA